MKKNIVFLPCRKGSQRIPNKNTKPFAGIEGGLLKIKLQQLLACDDIDEIILSSNDDDVIHIGQSFSSHKIKILPRPEELCSSQTSTDDLINYVSEIITDDVTIIWTHVTSPFINENTYKKMIFAYYDKLPLFDSLMSVNTIQTFVWNKTNPINYNRKIEKWPRTQTLPPLYEVNSGVFIAHRNIYVTKKDRIGDKVQLFPTTKMESIDIDWPEDFIFAEKLFKLNT